MTKPGPGKFQANRSLEESQILYEHSLDGSHPDFGESDGFGWFIFIDTEGFTGLEKSVCTSPAYICREDSQGFFEVAWFNSVEDAHTEWARLEAEYNDYINQPYAYDYMEEP